jgi:hypothetical protein
MMLLFESRWHPSRKNKNLKDGSLELVVEVAGTKEIKTGFWASARLPKSSNRRP